MKRLTVLLILFLAIAAVNYAAISAAMEWDVRTSGSDSNGGGFKRGATGTDYSQQDAAQQAYTDIVIGATTTQLTSVLFPFDATSVGNVINITGGAGCTVGRYEVASLSVITVTMDRSVGTAASVCTGNLGGSLLTIATALAVVTTGNSLHIKAGTYTQTSTLVAPGPALNTVGFAVTHNDGGTKPLITTATNSTNLWDVAHSSGGASMSRFANLSFSTTAAVRAYGLTDMGNLTSVNLSDLIFDGFTYAVAADNVGWVNLENVEIKNGVNAIYTSRYSNNPGDIYCFGCYIHDNTAGTGAVQASSADSNVTFAYSVISANNKGIVAGRSINLYNTDIANNTSDGVVVSGGYANAQNSVFWGNGGWGIICASCPIGAAGVFTGAPITAIGRNNAFGANKSGNYSGGLATPGEITLLGDPFTSATDFTLNSTAGRGLLLQKTGWPATISGSTTLGTLDVGAIQGSQGTTAGVVGWGFVQ
jgi:hypothetical protein